MSGNSTGDLKLSNHPDDFCKSGGWWVAQLSRSVVLTRWCPYSRIYVLCCRWDCLQFSEVGELEDLPPPPPAAQSPPPTSVQTTTTTSSSWSHFISNRATWTHRHLPHTLATDVVIRPTVIFPIFSLSSVPHHKEMQHSTTSLIVREWLLHNKLAVVNINVRDCARMPSFPVAVVAGGDVNWRISQHHLLVLISNCFVCIGYGKCV